MKSGSIHFDADDDDVDYSGLSIGLYIFTIMVPLKGIM